MDEYYVNISKYKIKKFLRLKSDNKDAKEINLSPEIKKALGVMYE